MKINFSIKNPKLKKILIKARDGLVQYRVIITSLSILIVFAGAVLRIDSLSNPEPSQDVLNEKLSAIKKVEFDKDAITQILDLKPSNVKISPEFEQARDNPFISN